MTTTLKLSELLPNQPKRITVDGNDVCVVREGDEVFAVADMCTHAEASLSEGEAKGGKIECWLHGAEFDLRTGAALTPPAIEAVAVFEVSCDGDTVTIGAKGR